MKLMELCGGNKENKYLEIMIQFIKFGIVGLSNTFISLGVYWICYYLLNMHYQASNIIAFIISVTNAYYWNYKFVFNKKDSSSNNHAKSYIKVVCSYGTTFLLSTGLLYVWVDHFNISAGIAPLINLIITIPLNFLLNRFWAFK